MGTNGDLIANIEHLIYKTSNISPCIYNCLYYSHPSVIQRVRMGKKVEKALSKDKNPSSATHLEDDNPNKTPEPYKCIGNFLTDFNELCRQNNMAVIPAVLTRPKPPV